MNIGTPIILVYSYQTFTKIFNSEHSNLKLERRKLTSIAISILVMKKIKNIIDIFTIQSTKIHIKIVQGLNSFIFYIYTL